MTFDEYEEKLDQNTRMSGTGADLTMHLPCPFCATADFLVYKLIDQQEALMKGAVCPACNRGMRAEVEVRGDETLVEFVQTSGDAPPDFLQMRRAT
jgi:hypothetical protein